MSKCAGCALKIDGYRTEHGYVTNEVLHLCGKTLNLRPYRVRSCENYKEKETAGTSAINITDVGRK